MATHSISYAFECYLCEFHKILKKETSFLLSAFILKNDIYPKTSGDSAPMTPEDWKRYQEIKAHSKFVDKVNVRKAIEGSSCDSHKEENEK